VRVLAVDPGEARLGIAISDPLGVVARPLTVLSHVSRSDDARRIIELAHEHDAQKILVGLPLDQDGQVGPQARKSLRLFEEIRVNTSIEVISWDESGSTRIARALKLDDELLDARAAAVFLQDYLDVQSS
jgi:putative Holliday junction resolvase